MPCVTEDSNGLTFAELLPDLVTRLRIHMAISEPPDKTVLIHCGLYNYPPKDFRKLYQPNSSFCYCRNPGSTWPCPVRSRMTLHSILTAKLTHLPVVRSNVFSLIRKPPVCNSFCHTSIVSNDDKIKTSAMASTTPRHGQTKRSLT